mmetsp:Transcript_30389/g.34052  ORF Transcript_30389/g.34052 Transcript_30389/m.34052 type:complete len:412 (+) Transcript_30389:77-1312(+)
MECTNSSLSLPIYHSPIKPVRSFQKSNSFLSTLIWVSLGSMSLTLLRDVSAAWGWDSSSSTTTTKEFDEVHINEEVTTLNGEEWALELPVLFDNQTSMDLHININRVNRETQEERHIPDTLLPTSGLHDPDRAVMAKFINTSSKSVHIHFVNSETKEEHMVARNVEPFVGEIDEDNMDDTTPQQQGVVIIQSHPGYDFAIFDEDRSFRTLLSVDDLVHTTHGDQALFHITDFDTDPLACKAHFINDLTTTESVVRVTWVNPDNGEETTVIDELSANQAGSVLTRKGQLFRAYDVPHHTFRTEFVIHNSHGQQQFLHITGVNGSANADKTLAKFINLSPKVVHINYINAETNEEQLVIENLRPREDQIVETHSGHQFVAYDEERTFRKVYTMHADKGMMESHHIHHMHHEEL